MQRKQLPFILRDLEKKLVFIVGPRQVGKTWLAKEAAKSFARPVYLNYDSIADREIIRAENWLSDTDLLIFDELHKMPDWKMYIKGVFDTRPPQLRIIVTGSARLDTFRQSGDSLAGRFFRHRLLPLSPVEVHSAGMPWTVEHFLERGGFPEPFLAEEAVDAARWRQQYIDGLIRSDILDFEAIHDFKAIQLVLELLRSRVGSPVSYASIARDAAIAPNTVKKYIKIFESLYIIFRVTPFSKNIARSLLKEPKLYFFDTGLVRGDGGTKFENFTALCLLKHLHAKEDYTGVPASLQYIRTKDGREVDFCLVEDSNPVALIEAKRSDAAIAKELAAMSAKYSIPGIQVVQHLKHESVQGGITLRRAAEYFGELML